MWNLNAVCAVGVNISDCHSPAVLHMDTVFHCLLGTILQIKWRMFVTWESDVPPQKASE